MAGCLFCNIIEGKLDTQIIYENDKVLCFEDINPQAPVHCLIVPKEHHENLNELSDSGRLSLMGDIFQAALEVAKLKGIDERGFRLIINNGKEGSQIISHLHMHILGGKQIGGGMAG